MRTHVILSCVLLCASAAGCQVNSWHTTKVSRAQAKDLVEEIRVHRDEQAARIQRLNAEYKRFFESAVAQLRAHFARELALDRITDAQVIADRIISDYKNETLRTNLTRSFGDAMVRQRTAILEADLAIAKARETYAAAYKDAKLKLNLLDEARAKVERLTEEDVGLGEAIGFARHIIDIVKEREKERKQPEKPPA